ncbi:GNAT family N-acetyltransferase [Spirosoma panaciterrae]|uniref:GNAT family N-acetyltransferase n=1 Tax=Spirosoma panaciterrae TaxID=496058 RepID=UPI00035F279C|nr:GNAT family N-acetyltransferase [Spirosoma panaciterrae]
MEALAPETIHLSPDEPIVIRLLDSTDAPKLTGYFKGLSAETRSYFAPHSFVEETVRHICKTLNPAEIVRLVATSADNQTIVAYVLLLSGATPSDAARFQTLGIPIHAETDFSIAPSIADVYQSRGLGSHLMKKALTIARAMNKQRIILWGGVQTRNVRAHRYYQKYGFVEVGQFENEVLNYDMYLTL